MKTAILTVEKKGLRICELLEAQQKYELVCFVNGSPNSWGCLNANGKEYYVYSPGKSVKLYKEGKIRKFIMPSMDEDVNCRMFDLLTYLGVKDEDILYVPEKLLHTDKPADSDFDAITMFLDRQELETVEIHAAEHCNLNCKNCSMFCGLVKTPAFPDYEKTKSGIKKLKNFLTIQKNFE